MCVVDLCIKIHESYVRLYLFFSFASESSLFCLVVHPLTTLFLIRVRGSIVCDFARGSSMKFFFYHLPRWLTEQARTGHNQTMNTTEPMSTFRHTRAPIFICTSPKNRVCKLQHRLVLTSVSSSTKTRRGGISRILVQRLMSDFYWTIYERCLVIVTSDSVRVFMIWCVLHQFRIWVIYFMRFGSLNQKSKVRGCLVFWPRNSRITSPATV